MDELQFKRGTDYSGLKGLLIFALIITGFHLLYKYFEPVIISTPFVTQIINFLVQNLVYLSSWILEHVGIKNWISKDLITLTNGFKIQILYGCSGFQQFLLIIILFILVPGPWVKKIWFIPAALLFLHFINLVRLVGLLIYFSHFTNHFQFIHDWIFRPLIYIGIFLSWVIWVELIVKQDKIKNSNQSP